LRRDGASTGALAILSNGTVRGEARDGTELLTRAASSRAALPLIGLPVVAEAGLGVARLLGGGHGITAASEVALQALGVGARNLTGLGTGATARARALIPSSGGPLPLGGGQLAQLTSEAIVATAGTALADTMDALHIQAVVHAGGSKLVELTIRLAHDRTGAVQLVTSVASEVDDVESAGGVGTDGTVQGVGEGLRAGVGDASGEGIRPGAIRLASDRVGADQSEADVASVLVDRARLDLQIVDLAVERMLDRRAAALDAAGRLRGGPQTVLLTLDGGRTNQLIAFITSEGALFTDDGIGSRNITVERGRKRRNAVADHAGGLRIRPPTVRAALEFLGTKQNVTSVASERGNLTGGAVDDVNGAMIRLDEGAAARVGAARGLRATPVHGRQALDGVGTLESVASIAGELCGVADATEGAVDAALNRGLQALGALQGLADGGGLGPGTLAGAGRLQSTDNVVASDAVEVANSAERTSRHINDTVDGRQDERAWLGFASGHIGTPLTVSLTLNLVSTLDLEALGTSEGGAAASDARSGGDGTVDRGSQRRRARIGLAFRSNARPSQIGLAGQGRQALQGVARSAREGGDLTDATRVAINHTVLRSGKGGLARITSADGLDVRPAAIGTALEGGLTLEVVALLASEGALGAGDTGHLLNDRVGARAKVGAGAGSAHTDGVRPLTITLTSDLTRAFQSVTSVAGDSGD